MATPRKKVAKKRKRRGHYNRGEYTSPIAGLCKHRSGWELAYMVYLDGNPEVERWEYEKLRIEYISNLRTGKIRNYIPDFYVEYKDGRREVVEIKPKRKLDQATIRKKTSAAGSWCSQRGISYVILTEVELKGMNLL
jgi:hypothetical protein